MDNDSSRQSPRRQRIARDVNNHDTDDGHGQNGREVSPGTVPRRAATTPGDPRAHPQSARDPRSARNLRDSARDPPSARGPRDSARDPHSSARDPPSARGPRDSARDPHGSARDPPSARGPRSSARDPYSARDPRSPLTPDPSPRSEANRPHDPERAAGSRGVSGSCASFRIGSAYDDDDDDVNGRHDANDEAGGGKQTAMSAENPDYEFCMAEGELQRRLFDMYRSQEMTDVVVRVEDTLFRCHRVVLCAQSSFFKRIVENEPEVRFIILQNTKPEVFGQVVEYMYTGKMVAEDNLPTFITVLLKMDMMNNAAGGSGDSASSSALVSCLERAMAPENCVLIWKQAQCLSAHEGLVGKAENLILTHFFSDEMTDQLKELSAEEIISIIDNPDLKAENEEVAVRRALDWMKATNATGPEAEQLFQRLRLPLTSLEFINDEVENLAVMKDSEACRALVEEAKLYLSNPERRHEFSTQSIAFRRGDPNQQVLLMFGGYKLGGTKATDMLALNLEDQSWYSLDPLPKHPGKGPATVVYDNNIYVTGGSRDTRGFWRYVSSDNRWEQGPSLINGRKEHSVEVLAGGVVCVMGGTEVGEDDEYEDEYVLEVETLGALDQQWKGVMDLILPVSLAAACSTGDGSKIFLYGGKISDGGVATNSVQCLDMTTCACTLLSTSMPVACSGGAGLRLLSVFVLFTGNGEVMKFETETAQLVSIDRVPHFKRKRFRTACHHDRLLVVGGEDSQQVYRDLLCLGLKENTSQLVPWGDFLPPVRAHFALAKVIMPSQYLGISIV